MDVQLSSSAVNSGNPCNLWGTVITPSYSKSISSPVYIGQTGSSDAVSEVHIGSRENPEISVEGLLNVDKTGSSYPSISKIKDYWKEDTVYIKDNVSFTDWTKVAIKSVDFDRSPEYKEQTKGNIVTFSINATQTL